MHHPGRWLLLLGCALCVSSSRASADLRHTYYAALRGFMIEDMIDTWCWICYQILCWWGVL